MTGRAPGPRLGAAAAGRLPDRGPRPLAPWPRLVATVTGRATGGEPLRLVLALGRHPRLFRRWLPFAGTLLLRGVLPAEDRELAILRTACRSGSAYEWVHHVPRARRAGLPADVVERVPAGPGAGGWTARQRSLLLAVDDIHDRGVVTDATWAGLAEALTERELVELCLLVGHYRMLAATLASLGVEPEPSALDHLDGAAAGVAATLAAGLARRRSGA